MSLRVGRNVYPYWSRDSRPVILYLSQWFTGGKFGPDSCVGLLRRGVREGGGRPTYVPRVVSGDSGPRGVQGVPNLFSFGVCVS